MIAILLAVVVVCLTTLFYIKWRRVKQYWAKLGVPHLPPHPLVGSLTFIMRENPGIWMKYVYEHFKTPYVGMWLFWRPALVVNCPVLARNILSKDSANFRNRFMASGSYGDPLGSQSILLVKDPVWTKLRKHLAGAFTSSKLKHSHNVAAAKAKELKIRLENEMAAHGCVDIRLVFTDYSTDVFGMTAFGVASDSTLTGESALRAVTKDFMQFGIWRGLCWGSIFFWPELTDIFGFTFTPKASTAFFKRVFRPIIDQYEENKRYKEPKSLLDVLMAMKYKTGITGEDVCSEDFILAQATALLVGGFDTTGSALTYVIYQLAFSEDIQERLYRDILESKRKYGDDFMNYEHVQAMTYVECIIKETMRLRPAMGWIDRCALNDYQVDEKLTIKAGTPVYINGNGMHYDPEYFPDPYKFDPDRFLPENENKIKPYTYLPFGEGPRMCLGERSAKASIKCAMLIIFSNFKVVPLPNSTKPADVKIDKRSLMLSPGELLQLKFIPREEEKQPVFTFSTMT